MIAPESGWAPAGFWRRYLAYSLDCLLLAPVLVLLLAAPLSAAWVAAREFNASVQERLLQIVQGSADALASPTELSTALLHDAPLLAAIDIASTRIGASLSQAFALAAISAAIYFISFEASAWGATPGKRLLGIVVLDMHDQRIDWRRAGGRFLAGSLNWLSFNLGHALAGWRADGRALHDLIAGTRVVACTPMPAWGRSLLFAQIALLLALIFGLLGRALWLLLQIQAAGLP